MTQLATNLAEANARLQAADKRQNKSATQTKAIESALLRKSMNTLTAGGFGAMNRFAVPPTIKGFPWKLGVWTIATGIEAMARGYVQAAAAGISDSTMTIYLYDSITKGTVIAGDEGGGEI
jgi:hypothetical protein